MLAGEEILVVEGCSGEADEDLARSWFWLGDLFDSETVVEGFLSIHCDIIHLSNWQGEYLRVVDLTRLAFHLLHMK